MPVKYLSQEWIDAYNDALAGDAVRGALKGKNATIQMVISDAPQEGEIHYWLRIEDGGAAAGLGDLTGPMSPSGRRTRRRRRSTAVTWTGRRRSPRARSRSA